MKRTQEVIDILEPLISDEQKTWPDDRGQFHYTLLVKCYDWEERREEAVELMENAVAALERTRAIEENSRLCDEATLASLYDQSGRIEKAIEIMKRVVAVRKPMSADGQVLVKLLRCQCRLGMYYRHNGRVKDSIELLESAIAGGEKANSRPTARVCWIYNSSWPSRIGTTGA